VALLLALVAFGAWWGARGPTAAARHGSWVFVAAVASISLLCLTVARTDFSEPRYLFAAYAGVAPLVGGLVEALRSSRWLRAALVAALLALNVGSQITAPRMRHRSTNLGFFGEMDLTRVLAELRARGVRTVYASYWVAYRLTFLSGNEILSSPLGTGTHGAARIGWLKAAVDADRSAAFLLRDADQESIRAFLAARGFAKPPTLVDGFALYTDLPPRVLRLVRQCACVPTTVGPGEIVFSGIQGPDRMSAGASTTHRVRVRNASPRSLSANVSLSYHWLKPDGSTAVWDGARSKPASWPPSGEEREVEIEVLANVAPGEYDLVFDLVDEGVTWFESMNGPPPKRRVRVEPAGGV
jgi:hypothetical protein